MSKWDMVKLGDVCEIERGGSPRPIQKFITDNVDGINWIKIGDTSANSMYITRTKEKIIPEGMKKSRYVQAGDFLLTNSMSFGRPYILKIDGCIHDGWLVLRDKMQHFHKAYLYYALSSKTTYAKFKSLAVGGVVNNLNSNIVKQVEFPLPPLEVQSEIAKILDVASELIALRKKQLVELDNLIKATFYDMFGDPVTNEKGWEVFKIGELIIDVKNGITRRGKEDISGKIVLKLKDIRENYVIFEKCNRFVLEEKEEKIFRISKNQLLFVRVNGNPDYVGRCAVFDDYHEAVYYNDHIMRVSLNNEIIDTCYLSRLLNFPYGKKEIKNYIKTSAGQFTINQQGLSSITVTVPPIYLQKRFTEIVTKIEEQKALVQKTINESQYLFDSLMSEYFE